MLIKENEINHELVIWTVKIRKVLFFYEVPSMSHCLRSRMLLLAFKIAWSGTHPQFSSSHNYFLPRTWSDNSELHVSLVSLHQNEFKQQDLVPLQMWVHLIYFCHLKPHNLWESISWNLWEQNISLFYRIWLNGLFSCNKSM